jgi:hypothetical protein
MSITRSSSHSFGEPLLNHYVTVRRKMLADANFFWHRELHDFASLHITMFFQCTSFVTLPYYRHYQASPYALHNAWISTAMEKNPVSPPLK